MVWLFFCHSSCVYLCVCLCPVLPDRDDWLELNDGELKAVLPGVKPVVSEEEGKAPAPMAGPHVGPAVGPDAGPVVGPDAVLEPKGPNVPILPKPPLKVRLFFCSCISAINNDQSQSFFKEAGVVKYLTSSPQVDPHSRFSLFPSNTTEKRSIVLYWDSQKLELSAKHPAVTYPYSARRKKDKQT